jgi:hypothetical protein
VTTVTYDGGTGREERVTWRPSTREEEAIPKDAPEADGIVELEEGAVPLEDD